MKFDKFVSATFILSMYLIFDYFMKDSMFLFSNDLVVKIQDNSESLWTSFFTTISFFGYEIAIGTFLIYIILFLPNKIYSLEILIYVSSSIYIMSMLKLFFMDPRPYFI